MGVVISTVHDVQVFDELPESLFSSHDLPVDIIVAPTEVIRVSNRLPKPDHLQWDIITREKFEQVGILKELQFREKMAGKCVKLSDGYEDIAPEKDVGDLETESNKQRINGDPYGSENTEKVYKGRESKNPKRNNPRKRVDRNAANHHSNGSNNESRSNGISTAFDKGETKRKDGQRNKRNLNNRNHESIGIFVGRIPRTARVKELKDAIQERGLRTNNLVWKGVKGFAFLYFDKSHTNMSEEEICLQLKDLKLGETVLNIEPDKRKDKNKENTGSDNGQQDSSVDKQNRERVKSDNNKNRKFIKSRANKDETNSPNIPSESNEGILSSPVDEYTKKDNSGSSVENGMPNATGLCENVSVSMECTSNKAPDVSESTGKIQSAVDTNVNQTELKIKST